MSIEQQWQAAKEEFKDNAFKRVRIKTVINTFLFPTSNPATESAIKHAEIEGNEIEFIPPPYLFAHDVSVYGENAYLMWGSAEIEDDYKFTENSGVEKYFRHGVLVNRKKSAALPFDIKRANNGDSVQVYIEGELIDMDYKNFRPVGDLENFSFKFPRDLRMKYPPRLKK